MSPRSSLFDQYCIMMLLFKIAAKVHGVTSGDIMCARPPVEAAWEQEDLPYAAVPKGSSLSLTTTYHGCF